MIQGRNFHHQFEIRPSIILGLLSSPAVRSNVESKHKSSHFNDSRIDFLEKVGIYVIFFGMSNYSEHFIFSRNNIH